MNGIEKLNKAAAWRWAALVRFPFGATWVSTPELKYISTAEQKYIS
jgi:hypothetical protein